MAKKSAEATQFDAVTVADREFPVGTITAYQLFCAKNLVINLVISARAKHAQRQAEITPRALALAQQQMPTVREQIAARLGVDVEQVDEATYMGQVAELVNHEMLMQEEALGYGGQMGLILDALLALSSDQIIDLATLMIDRTPDTEVTRQWVAEHFDLLWFTEALALLLESNNIPGIVKNFQRLGMAVSTQLTLTAKRKTA